MGFFPLAAALVSAAFCMSQLQQFLRRRKLSQLAWGLAMAAFAAASFAAALGMLRGWTPGHYRTYYLFGAVVNVPVLALGTLYLHLPRRGAHLAALGVLAASIYAAAAVFGTELLAAPSRFVGTIPPGSEVMPASVRNLSRYYSYSGFLVVVGGAVWASLRMFRKPEHRFRRMAQGNALIALGAVVVALGSAFARYGQGAVFAVGLAAGVSVMFAGFLRTRSTPSRAGAGTMPAEASLRGQAAR